MTAVERLNDLLAAERTGVESLSCLFPEARSPEMQLFEGVGNDEASSCARARSLQQDAWGGHVSAEKVTSEPTLAARLRFLSQGQRWGC